MSFSLNLQGFNINAVSPEEASRLVVTVVYLEVLNRAPTTAELGLYAPQIQSGSLTSQNLEIILRGTNEYLQLVGVYAANSVYDDATWTITLSQISSGNYSGLTLANGKLAIITDSSYNKIKKAFISTSFDYNSFGRYVNNVAETFQYTTVDFFTRDPSTVSVNNSVQTLLMRNGSYRQTYTISSILEVGINGQPDVITPPINVVQEITPLRPYPYCVLQTMTLTSLVPVAAPGIMFYHEFQTPSNIIDVRYGNNLITVYDSNGTPTPVNFFNATGKLDETKKYITSASCYLFEGAYSSQGYNIVRSDNDVAYNSFYVQFSPVTNLDGSVIYVAKFNILTATMSQYDFEHPDVEAQRILINLSTRTPASLYADNTTAWASMWNGNINIEPKDSITVEEATALTAFKRNMRFALYNIYAVIREDVNVEVNPLNLSTIDLDGHIFWSAELWLIPVLLFFKPAAARTLLDYRYYNLSKALKLAAAQGYKGSKFPYANDTVGYNDVYWDTVAPLAIYNTALISISTWNYYRISRDVDWLKRKGYEILRNNADFFASKMEYSASDGLYHLNNVVGMNNTVGNDNTMTNYLANMAINYAVQATYEINYVVNSAWTTVLNKVAVPVRQTVTENGTTLYNILPVDDSYALPDTIAPNMKFVEPLIVMHPYYSRDFFKNNLQYDVHTILSNTSYYRTKLTTASAQNAINCTILGALSGTAAQQETTYAARDRDATQFYADMQLLNVDAVVPPWNTLYNSLFQKSYNDIGVSSAFILSILSSLAGIRVAGGINEARFLFEDYGIKSRTSYVLPRTWKRMTITGVGWNNSTYTLTNALYYPYPNPVPI